MDGNYENRGELYLEHRHEGIDLDIPYAQETLRNLFTIWTRPIHLKTYLKEKGLVVFSIDHDGLELNETTAD